ncbi:transcriptional adapter 1 isoform X2 [Pteropus alecto]|uniref:transcriptional adapter 1 isoform X2 n=1 Tax=Pteropus alecto TaxID=9402 RepID=UPI000D535005|nr:transcriptional adapter 1 isoform X2 [Pteropus alecto]
MPQASSLNNRHSFSHSSGGWKPDTKVSAALVSSEACPRGCRRPLSAVLPAPPLRPLSSHKDTSRSGYWANLKLWFKQKISKEEFDLEAHRLLTQDNVHSHNDFLLAILTRCQILVSTPEGAGSLPWTGGSAAKPGKPKGKKKLSSVRQKFDHRFQPQNPLSGAQQFVAKDPQDDDDLKLCSHTMMLPTRGQLEGRMIVTAYEHGLDNVTEEAVSAVVYAVEPSSLLCALCWPEPGLPPAPRRRRAAGGPPAGLLWGHPPCVLASREHVRPLRGFAGAQGGHPHAHRVRAQHRKGHHEALASEPRGAAAGQGPPPAPGSQGGAPALLSRALGVRPPAG